MSIDRSESSVLPVAKPALQRRLAHILRLEVTGLTVAPFESSSREAPWRIDVHTPGHTHRVVARFGESCSANEATALQAMRSLEVPTPQLLHWDPRDPELKTALFVSSHVGGAGLLQAMKDHEPWAEELYIDTACTLQGISCNDLSMDAASAFRVNESADDVLESAYSMFATRDRLVERAYRRLKGTKPMLPTPEFSNGDLWPENLRVCGRRLVGVIDWQHAGFSDPFFEFLLPFFLVPEVRGRGLEERYCARKGLDPALLHWYHGLEFFDSLRWVLKTGKPYEMHTAESLRSDLASWLAS